MTTFKHPRGTTWRYDFRWTPPGETRARRYQGSTGQLTKADAELVELEIKRRVRQEQFGVAPFDRARSPSITAFAFQHLKHVTTKGTIERLDAFTELLKLCLQFWGRRPKTLPDPSKAPPKVRARVEAARDRMLAAPYHDLRLVDPILDPSWIERFEVWLSSLGLSGARKNHYRSAMSGIYRTALLPQWRQKTGVTSNPFLHIERDRVRPREAVLTLEQLRAWIDAAAPHVRIAMALAVYAPELRSGAILGLTWRKHLDAGLTKITTRHKTERWTGRAQVVPVSRELQTILHWARRTHRGAAHVVAVRTPTGKYVGVKRIDTALRASLERANESLPADQRMTYGAKDGVTFHTIRHTMATLMAEWGEPDALRQMLMGHASSATTAKYTHLAGRAKIDPLERVAAKVDLGQVVQGRVQEPLSKISAFLKVSEVSAQATSASRKRARR